jgi:hypothetical protein
MRDGAMNGEKQGQMTMEYHCRKSGTSDLSGDGATIFNKRKGA